MNNPAKSSYSQLELSGDVQHLCKRNSDDLLEAILRPYEVEFNDSKIRLEIVHPFPKVEILASENSLSQVFDNLIANAKRYVGESGVITVGANADDRYLTVSVSDDGSGISPEDLPHAKKQSKIMAAPYGLKAFRIPEQRSTLRSPSCSLFSN